MAAKLLADYLWTESPIIINAPMGGFAGDALATAVTSAGGIGMIGGVFDMEALAGHLERCKSALSAQPPSSSTASSLSASSPSAGDEDQKVLPVGVGLLPFASKLDEALPVLAKYRPAILWLFAANEFSDYGVWAREARAASPNTKLWVQVGSVTAALEVCRTCDPPPDVLVMQGSDAGGHGFERGAGIISLLPEATDVLREEGFGDIPLVAAGGIVDGRGVVAAVSLGAAGVVMGTRFLAADETIVPHPLWRTVILKARDGGLSTGRSKVFDELRGANVWPPLYDGRALATSSFADHQNGVDIETIRARYREAVEGEGTSEDPGYVKDPRVAVWAGSGVGLVNETKPAKSIVTEVRNDAISLLLRISGSFVHDEK